jgi:hypothetical protein
MSSISAPKSAIRTSPSTTSATRRTVALIDRLVLLYLSYERLVARMRDTEAGIEAVRKYSVTRGFNIALSSGRLVQLTAQRRQIAIELAGLRAEAARLCIPQTMSGLDSSPAL